MARLARGRARHSWHEPAQRSLRRQALSGPYGVATSFINVAYDLYAGETASASVRHTLCRGTMVYDRGEILTAPGHGRYVPRSLTPAKVAA